MMDSEFNRFYDHIDSTPVEHCSYSESFATGAGVHIGTCDQPARKKLENRWYCDEHYDWECEIDQAKVFECEEGSEEVHIGMDLGCGNSQTVMSLFRKTCDGLKLVDEIDVDRIPES